MKIESHEMQMHSEHSFSRVELETNLSFSTVYLELEEQKAQDANNAENIETQEIQAPEKSSLLQNNSMDLVQQMIQEFINRLLQMDYPSKSHQTTDIANVQNLQGTNQSEGITLHHTSLAMSYQEDEQLDFCTKGCIQTDKGSLDIDMNFSMKRSFAVENRIDTYSLFDPLVVNIDGDLPELSQKSFSFDLDNDGKSDQISTLGSNSGFLALDKNNDGIINQGSELFGTKTGDGFGELSEYDKDNNGWIDENDSIFDKLQIWLKNEDSQEKELVGLGEVGIGAIFLNSQSSEFTFKTQTNQTLGEMKSCGMFLKEDGTCGTISQIDFATRNTKKSMVINQVDEQNTNALSKLLQA